MDGPGTEPIRTPCTNIISVILNFSLSLKLLLTQDRDTTHHPGLLRAGSENLINEIRDMTLSPVSAHGRTYARTVCITWVFGTVQDVQSCSTSSLLAVNPPIYRSADTLVASAKAPYDGIQLAALAPVSEAPARVHNAYHELLSYQFDFSVWRT